VGFIVDGRASNQLGAESDAKVINKLEIDFNRAFRNQRKYGYENQLNAETRVTAIVVSYFGTFCPLVELLHQNHSSPR